VVIYIYTYIYIHTYINVCGDVPILNCRTCCQHLLQDFWGPCIAAGCIDGAIASNVHAPWTGSSDGWTAESSQENVNLMPIELKPFPNYNILHMAIIIWL
jgi:hypothetical protein